MLIVVGRYSCPFVVTAIVLPHYQKVSWSNQKIRLKWPNIGIYMHKYILVQDLDRWRWNLKEITKTVILPFFSNLQRDNNNNHGLLWWFSVDRQSKRCLSRLPLKKSSWLMLHSYFRTIKLFLKLELFSSFKNPSADDGRSWEAGLRVSHVTSEK